MTNVQRDKCTNVQMYKCTNVQMQKIKSIFDLFHNLVELYQKKEQKAKRKEEHEEKEEQNNPIKHPGIKSSQLDIKIAMARMARRFH